VDLKAMFSTLKMVLMVALAEWLLLGISQAATFQNANNEDLSVLISTDHYYGNHIGDLIPVKIVVMHKTEGVKVLDRVPRTGSLGDFVIVSVETDNYPNRTVFSYALQTFLPPKRYPSPLIGAINLHYTATRYWSGKDQRYVYQSLQTKPFAIFQNSLDPENKVPFVYEFGYFSLRRDLAYLLVAFGLMLMLTPLFPGMKSFALRYIHDRNYYRTRAFLKKIIEDDLSLYNTVNVCRKLNRIRSDDLLTRVLYQHYRATQDEIKRVAREALSCIEEKRCELRQE
jgi:hypothetical protein